MPQIVQLQKAQRTIEEVDHSDFQIYTDGSTTDGTRNGGAGMIIARDKKVLHRWHAPTGVRRSAYSAEKAALEAALKWLKSENDWHKAVIVCDCESLVEATGNPHQADSIIVTLQRSIARIICSKGYSSSGLPDTVTFGAMNRQTQKPSEDPLYRNLPSGTWTKRPGER